MGLLDRLRDLGDPPIARIERARPAAHRLAHQEERPRGLRACEGDQHTDRRLHRMLRRPALHGQADIAQQPLLDIGQRRPLRPLYPPATPRAASCGVLDVSTPPPSHTPGDAPGADGMPAG